MPKLIKFSELGEKDILNFYCWDGGPIENRPINNKNMNEASYDGSIPPQYDDIGSVDTGEMYVDGNIAGHGPNIEVDINFPPVEPEQPVPIKTMTLEELFGTKVFDPGFYERVKNVYAMGGFYLVNGQRCLTLNEFDIILFDHFTEGYYENQTYRDDFIWGINKEMNQNPAKIHDMNSVFYDGMIFGLMRREYLETLLNYDAAHVLSCIEHCNLGGLFKYISQYE